MIFTNIMGGLGNQLFQIFTALSYELETGSVAIFPFSFYLGDSNSGTTVRYTYWDTIFKEIKRKTTFYASDPNAENKWLCYREQSFRHTPIPTSVKTDLQISGYFQSWKYFDIHSSKIACDYLKLNSLQEHVLSKYKEIPISENTRISMHFRLGDYKIKKDYHPVMPFEYYYSALTKCLDELVLRGITRDKITVLYFCEDEDEDFVFNERIEPLRISLPLLTFHRVCSMSDWEQMLVMANSHHHIIANSSFSWWGAYLAPLLNPSSYQGQNNSQLVYFPSKWFGPLLPFETCDLCPPCWNRVSVL